LSLLNGWVISIAGITMIASVAKIFCPQNSAGKVVGACSAIILTAVLLQPVKNIDLNDLNEYFPQSEYITEKRFLTLQQENEKIREAIIIDETESYILQRAAEIGVECDVTVKCRENIPYSVNIRTEDREAADKISEIIKIECGIPKERQIHEGERA